MIIDILTGFPEILSGAVNSSILRNALLSGVSEIWVHDLRHYTSDRHGKIDDSPYGGGPGMILSAQPVFSCLDKITDARKKTPLRIYMSPQGETLKQPLVEALCLQEWLVILCGHYKDVDARVFERDRWLEISLGDYIISGGELPAAVLVDAIIRLLPGSLGDEQSAKTDSFSDGLLDAPYYTKPEIIDGISVPEILISGHHKNIAVWRSEQKEKRTRERRPDLWEEFLNTHNKRTNH
jgi:tRNA (guanine37-N1)-methyltransferase